MEHDKNDLGLPSPAIEGKRYHLEKIMAIQVVTGLFGKVTTPLFHRWFPCSRCNKTTLFNMSDGFFLGGERWMLVS